MKIRGYIAVIALGLLSLLVVIVVFSIRTRDDSFEYGIVINGDSTATSVTLFKLRSSQNNEVDIVEQTDYCEIGMSLDRNRERVNDTIAALMPCLINVTRHIEQSDTVPKTSVQLGATAGMLLLEAREPLLAQLIISMLESSLFRYKNGRMDITVKEVAILSGQDESLYTWLAANYLRKKVNDEGESRNSADEMQSVGILELADGSEHQAFEILPGNNSMMNDGQATTLLGHEYMVKSTSNLCYGSDQAWNRHLISLIKNNIPAKNIDNPCMLHGTVRIVEGSQLDNNTCIETKSGVKLYDPKGTYYFTGTGDLNKCLTIVDEILNSTECDYAQCMKGPSMPPPANMTFFAVGNYYTATRAIPMRNKIAMSAYAIEMERYCGRQWSDVKDRDSDSEVQPSLKDCFTLAYINGLLSKMYKFDVDSWNRIEFRKDYDGQRINWPLGMIINTTTDTTLQSEIYSIISTNLFCFLLSISLLIILIGIVLAYKAKTKQVDLSDSVNNNDSNKYVARYPDRDVEIKSEKELP